MATWAKGVDFKNSANTARVGGVGIYGTDGSAQKAYLGIGTEPWNNTGLEVTSSEVSFKGNKVYHAGSKPTPAEIGAAASNHTHNYASTSHTHSSLTGTAGSTTAPSTGTGVMRYDYNVSSANAGTLPNSNNANGILTLNTHSGNYYNQLGFSSNGNLYHRAFNGVALDTTTAWKQIAFTNSSITGNAATATTLQTARTINGTSFNGSANITTANWGTARNLQIGNTAKSVNGSENVSWSLSEIGAAAASHTHNYAASPSAGGSASTVYLPRTSGASVSANYLPGANKFEFKEFGNDCANIPNANWYHIFTGQGGDANYNTQLALGMTTQAVYFRNRTAGTWGGWKQLAFTDSSISGNASTATKLQSARTISLGGILSGSASFDGSGNVTINATANDITTITKSLSVTTSWADTGITGSNLGSGTYAVQMYVNDGTNTSQYQEFYSGIMSWYSGTTNSGEADEILLHKAGHANNARHVYLRTIRTTGGGYLKLQISCTHAFSAASNIIFKFKKLI